jgi:hypothetical protein
LHNPVANVSNHHSIHGKKEHSDVTAIFGWCLTENGLEFYGEPTFKGRHGFYWYFRFPHFIHSCCSVVANEPDCRPSNQSPRTLFVWTDTR